MPLWPASTGHNPGTVALRKLAAPLTGIRHDGLAEPSKKKSSASEADLRGSETVRRLPDALDLRMLDQYPHRVENCQHYDQENSNDFNTHRRVSSGWFRGSSHPPHPVVRAVHENLSLRGLVAVSQPSIDQFAHDVADH
jgi:hypothetical protein